MIFSVLFGVLIAVCAAGGQSGPVGRIIDPQYVVGKTWEWKQTVTPVEKITVTNVDT